MQRTYRLLLVAAMIVIGAVWFMHWSRRSAVTSSEVRVPATLPDRTPKPEASQPGPSNPAAPSQEIASSGSPSSGNDNSPSSPEGVTTLPNAGPISNTPQNAMMPISGGKFELYRQGDLTFRLNTETGQACVLFATQAEWSKPLVYEHGCGNH